MASESLPMPTTPEGITLEWLRKIFKNDHIAGFEITNTRLNETTGKVYVTLSFDDQAAAKAADKPKHVLLKGSFNPAMFQVPGYKPLLMQVYTNEVNFYNKLAANLPAGYTLQVPEGYWADATADQGIVAMEDLCASGYKFGDCTRTYSVDLVRSGLEQLAALHGRTWGWDDQDAEHAWLAPNIYDSTLKRFLDMWDALILGGDRPPLPPIMKDRARVDRAISQYSQRNPRFSCFIHGDPHSGNTYINQADTKLRFLDWQIVNVGTCFHDVAYFMVGMLSVEERRKHEMELLDYYLAALERFGAPKLTRDDPEVMIAYRRSHLTGLGWVFTPYSMQTKERVTVMVERYAASIVDHKTIELLADGPDAAQ